MNVQQLKEHQIETYTTLLSESTNDGQKRFLRTQLYNIKRKANVTSNSITRNLPYCLIPSVQGSQARR